MSEVLNVETKVSTRCAIHMLKPGQAFPRLGRTRSGIDRYAFWIEGRRRNC